MGTRTYSRRAADGTRRPTALGIRMEQIRRQEATPPPPPPVVTNPQPQTWKTQSVTGELSEGVQKALDFAETIVPMTQYTARKERLLIYDEDGNLLADEGGEVDYVIFPEYSKKQLERHHLTSHNHPTKLTPMGPEDIRVGFSPTELNNTHMHVRNRQRTPQERAEISAFIEAFDVDAYMDALPKSPRVYTPNGIDEPTPMWVYDREGYRQALVEHLQSLADPDVMSLDHMISRKSPEQGESEGKNLADNFAMHMRMEAQTPAIGLFLEQTQRKTDAILRQQGWLNPNESMVNAGQIMAAVSWHTMLRTLVKNTEFTYVARYNKSRQ